MSKELREEFSKVKADALAIVTKAKDEKRDLTAEEKAQNDNRFSRCEQIKNQLAEEKRFAEIAVADIAPEVIQFAQASHQQKAQGESKADGKVTVEAHKNAVNQFIRSGNVPHELFTIVAGSGGVALPASPPVVIKRNPNPFKQALQAFGYPILTIPSYQNVPIFDDTANVADVIAQNATGENIKEPSVTNMVPGDILYDSGATWFANTLLNSVDYDMFSYALPMLNARIEEKEVAGWTSTITTGGGAASVGVTTASTSGVTYAELVAAKYSIPAALQRDLVWIVSRGFMRVVESMVDGQGRPLYRDSLSSDTPDLLLGYPVFLSDALADPAAGAVSGIIASASAIVAREAGARRVVRYTGIPTHRDQTGIEVFQNGGFAFVGSGVKLIKHAAS